MPKKHDDKKAPFSAFEKEAMRERAKELIADKENGEAAVLEKIAAMPGGERTMAERLHELIKTHAPELKPKTWYGMPAYADKDGKILCYFQSATRFKARYLTLGFGDVANLDDGTMWPVVYAITKLTAADETTITKLVRQAVS